MPLFNLPEIFSRLDSKYDSGAFIYPGKYMCSSHVRTELRVDAESENVPLTMYVIADLDSAKGIALMSNAVAALVSKAL